MNGTQTGLFAGLILGLAATSGFVPFLITLIVGVIGLGVGRALEGKLDLGDLIGRGRTR